MSVDLSTLIDDLGDEVDALGEVVDTCDLEDLEQPTPARGWDVGDTLAHLAYFDAVAALTLEDEPAFVSRRDALVTSHLSSEGAPGESPDVSWGRALEDRRAILERWRHESAALHATLVAHLPSLATRRLEWFGPPMGAATFISARLMEVWAHGLDVRAALGRPLDEAVSHRLIHVCHLGVVTRQWSFTVHGRHDPGGPVRVELEAPDGSTWSWGPPTAESSIRGTALDFALVVTQRRHPARTGLRAQGEPARAWLAVAQAFAGPATSVDRGR